MLNQRLERQWQLACLPYALYQISEKFNSFKVGPFIAIQVGDDIVTAFGGGLMLAFQPDGVPAFNLGLGVIVDPDVLVLGKGLVDGEALPAGETNIRLRKKTQAGFMIMLTIPLGGGGGN